MRKFWFGTQNKSNNKIIEIHVFYSSLWKCNFFLANETPFILLVFGFYQYIFVATTTTTTTKVALIEMVRCVRVYRRRQIKKVDIFTINTFTWHFYNPLNSWVYFCCCSCIFFFVIFFTDLYTSFTSLWYEIINSNILLLLYYNFTTCDHKTFSVKFIP